MNRKPTQEEKNNLRNIWAAAYTNFDEFLKQEDATIKDVKAVILGISTEVFEVVNNLKGEETGKQSK